MSIFDTGIGQIRGELNSYVQFCIKPLLFPEPETPVCFAQDWPTISGFAMELRADRAKCIESSSVFDRAIYTIMSKIQH